MQPLTLISEDGLSALSNPQIFSAPESNQVNSLRNFFNDRLSKSSQGNNAGIENGLLDRDPIQNFIQQELVAANNGAYIDPWGLGTSMNSDMYNVLFTERIIQTFKPELTVVNMQGVDICHSNFTEYCNNLRKADYAVGHLWDTIQNTPGMANDTILIVAPEHGRNLQANTIIDQFGNAALDHTSDSTSREIFCLVVGPQGKVQQNQIITQVTGESIDIVPTISHILGFRDDIPGGMLNGRVLTEAFV
jgi:hypothetical protein